MKKTLLITLDYPPMVGGVSHYYHNIVENLPNDAIEVLHNNNNALLFTSRFLWPKWIKGLWNTYRTIRKKQIQHLIVGQILPIGTIAYIINIICDIPYTVMTHAMDITLPFGETGSLGKQRLVKKILKRAHSVTTVSRYTQQQLLDIGVDAKKITLVYPCPHVVEQSITTQPKLEHKRIVLVVARLVERKGIDTAIRAMARVIPKHTDAHLVIVGEGKDHERLQDIVRAEELTEHVTFMGKASPEMLALWYNRCEMLIMPSRQMTNRDVEGFGIVFLEAGLFGKPVIGGNSGGVPDAIVDSVTGFLVDPLDTATIAEKILFLLEHTEQAKKMGESGRARVMQEFQWSKQAKKVEKLLS